MGLIISDAADFDYGSLDASTGESLAAAMITRLTNAGWTAGGTQTGSVSYTFTGLPSNNQVFDTHHFDELGSPEDFVRYTMKTTLASAFDVKIGADANEMARNLSDAINATTGSGTEWGTGTTQNADYASTYSGATLTITKRGNPLNGDKYYTSHNLSNITPGGSNQYLSSSYNILKSQQNAKCTGMSMKIRVHQSGSGVFVGLVAGDWYESLFDPADNTNSMQVLTVSAGRTLKMWATPFSGATFLPNANDTDGTCCFFAAPQALDTSTPNAISAVTGGSTTIPAGYHAINSVSGSDITLTGYTSTTLTVGTNSYTAGQQIYLTTAIDPTSWTSGGYVASDNQSWRIFFSYSDYNLGLSGSDATWRNSLTTACRATFAVYNNAYWSTTSNTARLSLVGAAILSSTFSGNGVDVAVVQCVGGYAMELAPLVAWPIADYSRGEPYIVGQLTDSFIAMVAVSKDPSTLPTLNGMDWIPLTDFWYDSNLAQGRHVQGCLFLRASD